jgi:uncharacterized membrane protein
MEAASIRAHTATAAADRAGRGRLWELDVARTVAIGMMVVFHASYDVDMLAPQLGVEPREGGLKLLQLATGSLFLFLVGISFSVSTARARARGLAGRALLAKQLRRAGEILAAATAISAVTLVLLDERYVRFGILHLIAVALVLAPLADRLGLWTLGGAVAILLAAQWVDGVSSDVPGLMIFGVRPESSSVGVDWYPLLPWLAPALLGVVAGKRLYPAGLRGAWGRYLPGLRAGTARVAGAPGRHALAVYLVHQAVLFPLVAATLFALGVDVDT